MLIVFVKIRAPKEWVDILFGFAYNPPKKVHQTHIHILLVAFGSFDAALFPAREAKPHDEFANLQTAGGDFFTVVL